MQSFPRLAIGALHSDSDPSPITWALLSALSQSGMQVQAFRCNAFFQPVDPAKELTGSSIRHLDAWLMSPDTCRELLAFGMRGHDLAVVAGSWAATSPALGGHFDLLCQWLDLPRVLVLDASQMGLCRLPQRPPLADAVLLDNITDTSQLVELQTTVETLWNVPVLGALEMLPGLRQRLQHTSCELTHADTCRALGQSLKRHLRVDRLRALAARRPLSIDVPQVCDIACRQRRLRVAIAYDEVFRCYFPDTLDLLEMRGAKLEVFSPLRDERLPAETDIVYLGCGHPEQRAADLQRNQCMLMALRDHVRRGGRIYAEGGGLAYLCQHVETPDGQKLPMAGIFSADVRLPARLVVPEPVEVTLCRPTWLGPAGTTLRGYLNDNWLLEPVGPVCGCVAEARHGCDLVAQHHALGSRVHLNFAAHPEPLDRFFEPMVAPAKR